MNSTEVKSVYIYDAQAFNKDELLTLINDVGIIVRGEKGQLEIYESEAEAVRAIADPDYPADVIIIHTNRLPFGVEVRQVAKEEEADELFAYRNALVRALAKISQSSLAACTPLVNFLIENEVFPRPGNAPDMTVDGALIGYAYRGAASPFHFFEMCMLAKEKYGVEILHAIFDFDTDKLLQVLMREDGLDDLLKQISGEF